MPLNRIKNRLPAALPVLIALAAYANSLPGDFVFDDVVLIEKGEALRQLDLHRIFLENYWGSERTDQNYRPLLLLTYALNHQLGGGALSFHLVNWLLFAGVVFLVWLLLLEILKDPWLASLGACVYAVLPVHTEAVTNIVGRGELLAALAILGALILSLKARGNLPAHRERKELACLVGVITFLGLCSKENTVVVPAVILVTCWVLRRRVPWMSLAASGIGVIAYLGCRHLVVGDKKTVVTLIDNPLYLVDPITRALNAIRLLGLHAWKTVVPIHLSADYSYNQIPVLGLGDPQLWLSVAVVIGGCVVLVVAFRNRSPLVALGVLFFLVALAPTSNVILPIGTIFAERLVFTPSLGYPLVLCGAVLALRSPRRLQLAGVVLGTLVVVYGARTWVRNGDWATASGMYLRMSQDAPRSTRSHQKTAEARINRWLRTDPGPRREELRARALESLDRALEIYPDNGIAQATLGEMLLHEGKHEEALKQLSTAFETLTRHQALQPQIYFLLGRCHFRLKDYPQAIASFSSYLRSLQKVGAPPDPRGYKRRGLAFAFSGRMQDALRDFTDALRLTPDAPDLWNNHAMCQLRLGDYRAAIESWNQALKVAGNRKPGDTEVTPARLHGKIADAWNRLAGSLEAAGDPDGAQKARREAARHLQAAGALPRS